jgi:zinc transporter, ZIP family
MKANGGSKKYIVALWSIPVVIGIISSVGGFTFLSNTSSSTISIAVSFAAGEILVMLAESMMQETHAEDEIVGWVWPLWLDLLLLLFLED